MVSFSTPGDATALYTESVRAFQACANRRYTYDQPGQPAAVWNVREVASTGGVLAATLNQEGTDDWVCRRALTTAGTIVIDILTCSDNPTDPAAVTIARQIAAKVTGQ